MSGIRRRANRHRVVRPQAISSLLTLLLLVGGLGSDRPASAEDAHGKNSSEVNQFLADKEVDLVGIVKVKSAENRWTILSDGDHLPFLEVRCEMQEEFSGKTTWPAGTSQSVMQTDYSDLIFESIAPPAIVGMRYLLWASSMPEGGEISVLEPWIAHPQGFLLIRGERGSEFVFWNGKRYAVSELMDAIKAGRRIPLDKISDPVKRLSIAEERLVHGNLGDEKAFIHGLLMSVLDPEGQARRVEKSKATFSSNDMFGMVAGGAQPHAIWYQSLALLRDTGKDQPRRKQVVAALTPVVATARPRIRLAVALALADLGSDAGKAALIEGFETDSGEVSSDPPDQMTFPGRYPFDSSSVTACSYALAKLGDRRGLHNMDPKVQLAAAEALRDEPDAEVRKTLADLAKGLEPSFKQLESSGELTKPRTPGDYTTRLPETWVRVHELLARAGDEESLRRLVEVYLSDAVTYPSEEEPPLPTMRPVSWSSSPSPADGICAADQDRKRLLARIEKLFQHDQRWTTPPFVALRESVGGLGTKPKEPAQPKPTEQQIAKFLNSNDPNQRAQGLAAAGYHKIDSFYQKVLDTALHGAGVEQMAAIYALGFYERDIPDGSLRQLLRLEDWQARLSAMELATRRNPGRFAQESMDAARAIVVEAGKGSQTEGEGDRLIAELPRIMCRLGRGPLPPPFTAGLKDADPKIRLLATRSLALSGNPEAIHYLEPLSGDPDMGVRNAAAEALRFLGPDGP